MKFLLMISLLGYISFEYPIDCKEQGGAVEKRWAHNAKVNGSRPFPAIITINAFFIFQSSFTSQFFAKQQVSKTIRSLSWPALVAQLVIVRRTYKQCRSKCEGRGFDPLREQVFSNPSQTVVTWVALFVGA